MDRRTRAHSSSRLALLLLLVTGVAATAFIRQHQLLSSASPRVSAASSSRPPVVVAGWRAVSSSSSTSSNTYSHRLNLPPFQQHHHHHRRRRARRDTSALQAVTGGAGGSNDLKETVLATIRSLYFPLTVLGAGVLGAWRPAVYAGLSEGFVTRALAAVMVLMGATLTLDDFKRIGQSRRAVLLGWCAQFSIMPSMALLMARLYRLPPHLAAGVVLVGCCPGGTASNLVTLLAEADVALSVTMCVRACARARLDSTSPNLKVH